MDRHFDEAMARDKIIGFNQLFDCKYLAVWWQIYCILLVKKYIYNKLAPLEVKWGLWGAKNYLLYF